MPFESVQVHPKALVLGAKCRFKTIHDRTRRCETSHLQDGSGLSDDFAIHSPGFARKLWAATHQSYSLERCVNLSTDSRLDVTMIVPCIDLMGGKVVQLVQGREKFLELPDPLAGLENFAWMSKNGGRVDTCLVPIKQGSFRRD